MNKSLFALVNSGDSLMSSNTSSFGTHVSEEKMDKNMFMEGYELAAPKKKGKGKGKGKGKKKNKGKKGKKKQRESDSDGDPGSDDPDIPKDWRIKCNKSKKWCEKFVNRINKKNKMNKLFDGKEPKIPASEKTKINAKCKGNQKCQEKEKGKWLGKQAMQKAADEDGRGGSATKGWELYVIIASVIAIIVLCIICYCCCCKKKDNKRSKGGGKSSKSHSRKSGVKSRSGRGGKSKSGRSKNSKSGRKSVAKSRKSRRG